MKKIICLVLVCVLAFAAVACVDTPEGTTTTTTTTTTSNTPVVTPNDADTTTKSEGVMTWAEYMAADLKTKVTIEAYVQGHQSWWDNKITIYAQDGDGGYFLYEMPCTEEMAAQLVPGTKIRVTGYKAEYAGEIEIMTDALDPATIEIIDGHYVADPVDVTSKLGTEEIANFQNMKVVFKGMTVKEFSFKESDYDRDIYLTLTYNDIDYSFCVENYLTGPDTDVYKAVEALKTGDVVDVEAFLYWWNGINPHITSVTVK